MTLALLTPGCSSVEEITHGQLHPPFADGITSFLADLSARLLSPHLAQTMPEISALGFWLRPSNIKGLQRHFWHPKTNVQYRPLGTVLHIAPVNVDTMFIYSWVCALLMGNRNLVRVSSRRSDVVDAVLFELGELFRQPHYAHIAKANVFVRYERDDEVTAELSSYADARIIWGGDETVTRVRAIPAKVTTRDIAFADKYSVALVDGDSLNEQDVETLAERLWRDTHPYQQMACSSPRVIFWAGDSRLQMSVFQQMSARADDHITEQHMTEHLVAAQSLTVRASDSKVVQLGAISVVQTPKVNHEVLEAQPGGGFFQLVNMTSLSELHVQLDYKCQTLGIFSGSDSDLFKQILNAPIHGVVRVVPIGQALDFMPVWDGYDLFAHLSSASPIPNSKNNGDITHFKRQ